MQPERLAQVHEVQNILLKAASAEAHRRLQELWADPRVAAHSFGYFAHVRIRGFAKRRDGVDGRDALREEGVGRQLGELGRPQVGGEHLLVGHPLAVNVGEALDGREAAGDGRVQRALSKLGVNEKESCGAYVANVGEAVVAMLGATSTGATWTSCSPDFGARAVADRFGQVKPRVLFASDGFVSACAVTNHSSVRTRNSPKFR